jgi:hypothetical protein
MVSDTVPLTWDMHKSYQTYVTNPFITVDNLLPTAQNYCFVSTPFSLPLYKHRYTIYTHIDYIIFSTNLASSTISTPFTSKKQVIATPRHRETEKRGAFPV